MSRIVLLDSGPLGMITHPRPSRLITQWLFGLRQASVVVRVPDIADYEVRRELVRAGRSTGLARLDELAAIIGKVPITSQTLRQAATCWAVARQRGRPAADDRALDADMILVAQAALLQDDDTHVIIATTNVGHLAHFIDARLW